MVNFPGLRSLRAAVGSTPEPRAIPAGPRWEKASLTGAENRNQTASEASAKRAISARAPELAARDAAAGKITAEDAIRRAETLAENGETQDGGRLLARAGDAFAKAGNFAAALTCYERMREEPFAATNTSLSPEILDASAPAPTDVAPANSNFRRLADAKIARLKQ